VVTPTADGNSVDVDYDASNARLDAWAGRHGVPAVRARWAGVALVCFEAPCARLQHGQAHVGLCAESSVLRSGGHASPAERSRLHHMPHCRSALTFSMRRRYRAARH